MPETGACEAAMTRAGACVASNQIRGPLDFVASLSNVEMATFFLQGTRERLIFMFQHVCRQSGTSRRLGLVQIGVCSQHGISSVFPFLLVC